MTIEVRCSDGCKLQVMDEWAGKSSLSPRCRRKMVRSRNGKAITDETTTRPAARKARRARIESLLDALGDERLCVVWQQVYHFPIDPAYQLPNRGGIIEDIADFAEVLQPSLDGMKPEQLCRLVEKYAACTFRNRLR